MSSAEKIRCLWRCTVASALVGTLGLSLGACSGTTGNAGAPGPASPPSTPVTPTGSATTITTATTITANITGVTIPATSPAQPVVKFQLFNENGRPLSGLTAGALSFAVAKLVTAGTQLAAVPPQTTAPAPLVSSQWQSYIYTTATPAPASPGTSAEPVIVGATPQPQAYIEPATAGKLVDNGDGTYQYTFAKDISADKVVSYDPTLTHRVGFEIRDLLNVAGATIAANSPVYTFQPSTGATTGITQYDIVDDQTCKNCHQVLAWHGGPRTEIKYCVMCHNPSSIDPSSGNTLDFKVMFHKIHMGKDLPTVTGFSLGNGAATGIATSKYYIFGYGNYSVSDYSAVAYPQADASNNSATVSATGQRFCATCHNANDPLTPQAGNFSTAISAAACGSCHDDINFATGQNHASNIVASDTECSTCHGPTNLAGGARTVVASHQNVVDAAIAKFKYTIVSITNTAPGLFPVATIKVTDPTNGDAPYDITAAGPFKLTGAALNVDVAWNTIDVNNIGSGSATGPTAGSPNQPITINFASGTTAVDGLTKNADGSFTKTATVAIPSSTVTTTAPAGVAASGSGIAALEGRAAVLLANNSGVAPGTLTNLGVAGVDIPFAINDPTPTRRAAIVDIAKCNVCHRVLTLHGQNRSDDINLCASCHNPNATDISRHSAASGACAASTLDNPIDFKVMIHQIHASGDPIAYGTSGVTICGFGGSANTFEVLYPSFANASLANCNACHNPGTYYPDYTAMQGTTIHAGANRQSLTDDVVISPNMAVCSSCHTDAVAKTHMLQYGGNPNATKFETGALNPASQETCSLCHGVGKVADVAVVHKLASFQ